MRPIRWDEYEAALLVDAYWRIEKMPSQKARILQELSEALRRRAIRKGMEIDSIFRNYNGMKMQYGLLQYLVTEGEKGLSGHVSKVIAEIEAIYEKDYPHFLQILAHARQESGI